MVDNSKHLYTNPSPNEGEVLAGAESRQLSGKRV